MKDCRRVVDILNCAMNIFGCSLSKNEKFLDARPPSIALFLLVLFYLSSLNEFWSTNTSYTKSTQEPIVLLIGGFSACMVLFYRIKNRYYFEKLMNSLHNESFEVSDIQQRNYGIILRVAIIFTGVLIIIVFKIYVDVEHWSSRKVSLLADYVSTVIIYFELIYIVSLMNFLRHAVHHSLEMIKSFISISDSFPPYKMTQSENADLIIIDWTRNSISLENHKKANQFIVAAIDCMSFLPDIFDFFSQTFEITVKFCYGTFITLIYQQIFIILREFWILKHLRETVYFLLLLGIFLYMYYIYFSLRKTLKIFSILILEKLFIYGINCSFDDDEKIKKLNLLHENIIKKMIIRVQYYGRYAENKIWSTILLTFIISTTLLKF